jgi:hypothetical protein
MHLRRFAVAVAAVLSTASCSDVTPPTPAIGHRFVLESVDGHSLPIQHDEAYLQIADTVTILAGPTTSQRILRHRRTFELFGELQHSVDEMTYDLRSDGVLAWTCPLVWECIANIIEARVQGDQLRITALGADSPGEFYRLIP